MSTPAVTAAYEADVIQHARRLVRIGLELRLSDTDLVMRGPASICNGDTHAWVAEHREVIVALLERGEL